MMLPFAVLTAFLQTSELRVVSQDTVFFIVAKRAEWQKHCSPAFPAGQIKQGYQQLTAAVRMPRLTPHALAFIAPHGPWISQRQSTTALFVRQHTLDKRARSHYNIPAHWASGACSTSPRPVTPWSLRVI
jgi:hypothetical protein